MKILLANKFFYFKGGAEISFFETAKLLEKHNHTVLFFSMHHPNNFETKYKKYFTSNVNYESSNILHNLNSALKIFYSFEAKRKIEELIKEEKPEIAHLNNIYHQISPSIVHSLKKFGIPIVMTLRDLKMVCASYLMLNKGKTCDLCRNKRYYNCFLQGCVKNSRMKSLINTIEMYLHHQFFHIYDLVDVFISPSQFLKAKVEEMGFKGKIVHLSNFVNFEEYTPQYEAVERSLVYFGRLSREKGLFTLIEAMRGIDAKLKIIGEGPLREALIDKMNVLGLKNVEFLGYKSGEELKSEIKKSMAVVLTSEWYENNPRSIIEGFALGKPAIGARIGGIPELVRDGDTGLTFTASDSADLHSKIMVFLGNPQSVERMGRNARRFVEEELGAEVHYKKLMDIYKMVLNKKGDI